MLLFDAITQRRLIKPDTFNGKIIDDKLIEQLLDAANWAPNHGNTEPWRFVIYKQNAIKNFCNDHAEMYKSNTAAELFSESTYRKIATRGDMASHLIVCYMKRGNNAKIPLIEEICAAACAIQNLWLMATQYQIGLYWGTGGMVHHSCMKTYFNLEEEDSMMGLLFVGYTDMPLPKGKRNTDAHTKTIWK